MVCHGNNESSGSSAQVAVRRITDALANAGVSGVLVSVEDDGAAAERVVIKLTARQATDVASVIEQGAGVAV